MELTVVFIKQAKIELRSAASHSFILIGFVLRLVLEIEKNNKNN
jgi:hypothetical protein